MKTIKLKDKKYPFKKSAYAYKDFEDRNKRQFNPGLASDLLDYIFSCIQAGYFYHRQTPEIDIVDFYTIIDELEEIDPEQLYNDNSDLFKELLGIQEAVNNEVVEDTKKK